MASKTQNGRFQSKFALRWKKVCFTKFLCVKTVGDKVVNHSLTNYQCKMIGGHPLPLFSIPFIPPPRFVIDIFFSFSPIQKARGHAHCPPTVNSGPMRMGRTPERSLCECVVLWSSRYSLELVQGRIYPQRGPVQKEMRGPRKNWQLFSHHRPRVSCRFSWKTGDLFCSLLSLFTGGLPIISVFRAGKKFAADSVLCIRGAPDRPNMLKNRPKLVPGTAAIRRHR